MVPSGNRSDIVRYFMWNRLFENNGIKDYRDRRKAKKALLKSYGPSFKQQNLFQPSKEDYAMLNKLEFTYPASEQAYGYQWTGTILSLDCNMETAIDPPLVVSPKKEKNMCYECDDFEASLRSDEARTKEYLVLRLYTEATKKRDDAYIAFNISDDPSPTDGEELVKRITSGKYVLDLEAIKATKKNSYFSPKTTLGITWRDPAKPADKDGFDAYIAKVNAARQASEDIIRVSSTADGLKELNAFKAATF